MEAYRKLFSLYLSEKVVEPKPDHTDHFHWPWVECSSSIITVGFKTHLQLQFWHTCAAHMLDAHMHICRI